MPLHDPHPSPDDPLLGLRVSMDPTLRLLSFGFKMVLQGFLWAGQEDMARELLFVQISGAVDTTIVCIRKAESKEQRNIDPERDPIASARLFLLLRRVAVEEGLRCLMMVCPSSLRDWTEAEYRRMTTWGIAHLGGHPA